MTQGILDGIVALAAVVGLSVLAGALLGWFKGVLQRCGVDEDCARADALIAKNSPFVPDEEKRPRHLGFDPDLRTRTAVKRKGAEAIRRIALRVESGTEMLEVVHDVKILKDDTLSEPTEPVPQERKSSRRRQYGVQ